MKLACADAPSETQLQFRTAHHVLGQTDEHLQGVRGEASQSSMIQIILFSVWNDECVEVFRLRFAPIIGHHIHGVHI